VINQVPIPPSGTDPTKVDRDKVHDQLDEWIRKGTVTPAPTDGESNPLYFIFLPPGCDIDPSGASGFHSWDYFYVWTSGVEDPDVLGLLWAVVKTPAFANPNSTANQFVNKVARIASHELAESLTDPVSDGFVTDDGCEISDLCEQLSTFKCGNWDVELYYSNWDNSCIRGDQPISLRRFLKAIDIDGTTGLRQLQSDVINVDFIASKM